MSIKVGTSGWTYDGWRGPFYPAQLAKKDWLKFYATRFATTEINGSFYRTPSLDAVTGWRDQTPHNFGFAWKASKFITHWKRLSDKCDNSIDLMQTRLKKLGPKVAAVLFQLPPNFKKDAGRLDAFLDMLPVSYAYAFEFRDPSWYSDDILALLESRRTSLCISDHHDAPSPWAATAKLVYVRGHGPGGSYKGNYSKRALALWTRRIKDWSREGREILVYFDNDQKAAAPSDALRLIEMVDGLEK